MAEGSSTAMAEGSSTATADGSSTATAEGSSTATADGSSTATADGSISAMADGSCTAEAFDASSGEEVAAGWVGCASAVSAGSPLAAATVFSSVVSVGASTRGTRVPRERERRRLPDRDGSSLPVAAAAAAGGASVLASTGTDCSLFSTARGPDRPLPLR